MAILRKIYDIQGRYLGEVELPETIAELSGAIADDIAAQIPGGALNPSRVEITKVSGDQPGTVFWDDFTTTARKTWASAKWSQGLLPLSLVHMTPLAGFYWSMVNDPAAPGYYDGVSEVGFRAGVAANAKAYLMTQAENRYKPGHLSFFGGTASWDFSGANGDALILFGAFQHGPRSLGRSAEIRNAMAFGYSREAGVLRGVHVIVKNYVWTYHYFEQPGGLDPADLTIFELELGYYGVHPSIVKYAKAEFNNNLKLALSQVNFLGDVTSVSDPNLSQGVYFENRGNTGAISLRNGSIESGNYIANGEARDAGARPLDYLIEVASIAVDADDSDKSGWLGIFAVTDVVSMVAALENGAQTFGTFPNSITNELIGITAIATANRNVNLTIRDFLIEDVTFVAGQTWTPVSPGYSVLQRATPAQVAGIDFAKQLGPPLQINIRDTERVLELSGAYLRPGRAALVSLVTDTGTTTATDVSVKLNTRDLT